MSRKNVLYLSLCTVAVILVAGCTKAESTGGADGTRAGTQNSVQSVLQQGMAGTEAAGETGTVEAAGEVEASGEVEAAGETEAAGVVETAGETEAAGEVEAAGKKAAVGSDGIDVDLTSLSSTMVYSEVYNMVFYPENYVGKTVKMKGSYAIFYDEDMEKYYHTCIISDATACCAQGIEFELTDDYAFPDDYPEEDDVVCVTGTFDT